MAAHASMKERAEMSEERCALSEELYEKYKSMLQLLTKEAEIRHALHEHSTRGTAFAQPARDALTMLPPSQMRHPSDD